MRSLSDRKGAAWAGLVGVSVLACMFLGGGLGMMCFTGIAAAALWGLVIFTTKASYDREGRRYVDGVLDETYKPKGDRSGTPTDINPKPGARRRKE